MVARERAQRGRRTARARRGRAGSSAAATVHSAPGEQDRGALEATSATAAAAGGREPWRGRGRRQWLQKSQCWGMVKMRRPGQALPTASRFGAGALSLLVAAPFRASNTARKSTTVFRPSSLNARLPPHLPSSQFPRQLSPLDSQPRGVSPAMAAMYGNQQPSVYPESYVGFDSITKQIEKKLVKRGFQFNIICVGKLLRPSGCRCRTRSGSENSCI